ncbi:hypothetical protein SELMODRAFT_270650 [Selaginella moellendorffii]|uniref:Methanethiol oxidase n=1 Tax=Selaginella moellendorffii TaxID=88036 RepID=D8R9Q9_SELML|nr:uncharacterized protein LOC9630877 [Selaginella moellendorffii]EFJ30940.1 hypothetical protein SELMODRAFT_270650 [Selaginella moellendorffii]|eukprot:XP_002967593.1 uncharacterized protein LOC9630877 [Selaginella moellendorffii]
MDNGNSIVPIVGIQKKVSEYALPATVQTHEVVPIGDELLLITQQECNGIIKVTLDPATGSPTFASKFTLDGSTYQGAHGLRDSKAYPGYAWVTLQFDNSLLLIDPIATQQNMPPRVEKRFRLPKPLRGPHVVIEDGSDYLWVTCKDSCHVAKVNHREFAVVAYYPCSRRPIFVAPTHEYVYASMDESSRIFCLQRNGEATSEIEIPAGKGSTPVGLITGPDGNAWFVLLGNLKGGTGTFGRISINKVTNEPWITWFHLTTATTAGLLHLAFDNGVYHRSQGKNLKIWLLGSSIGSPANINAVFTVHLQPDPKNPEQLHLEKEEVIVLPTQSSMAHRVLKHRSGLFVTELSASVLAHISGTAVWGPDRDDQAADAYALWGLGALSNRVHYPSLPLAVAEPTLKRKKILE